MTPSFSASSRTNTVPETRLSSIENVLVMLTFALLLTVIVGYRSKIEAGCFESTRDESESQADAERISLR